MTSGFIPYGRQSVNEADVARVAEVLRGDWLTTGPAVTEFENALAEVTGAPTAVVSSGTAALHCAFAAAGIGPGDHVIVPAMTFVATAAAAKQLGADVTIVDVEEDSLNIDPDAAVAAITSQTKAIVAVDFAGHPSEYDRLRAITDQHGILLIDDASHALGATYRGRPIGSIADLTTFSFHPVKPITTGEGGAVSSPHPELLERVRLFRSHGLVRDRDKMHRPDEGGWHQEVHEFGLNYRMPDINAALGASQLKRLDGFLAARQRIAHAYDNLLDGLAGLDIPRPRGHVQSGWHLYVVRIRNGRRRHVFDAMRGVGIGVQVHYLPVHLHPVFGGEVELRIVEAAYSEVLSLPMFPDLGPTDQERVVETLKQSLAP